LKFYNSFCKDIKKLGQLQDTDRRLKDIKDKTTKTASTPERNESRKKMAYSVGGTVWKRGRPCCHPVYNIK
jgi:hypothetical protein